MEIPVQANPTQRPTVEVGFTGQCLSSSPNGQTCWEQLLHHRKDDVLTYLQGRQPFKLVQAPDWIIDGRLTPQGFVLTWFELTDTEIRLALVQAVSRAVNASLLLDDIFDSLGMVLQEFLPYEGGRVVVLDESQNNIQLIVDIHVDGQAETLPLGPSFSGNDVLLRELIATPKTHILDLSAPPTVLINDSLGDKTHVVVPLMSKGVVLGALSLSGSDVPLYYAHLVESVSEQLAVAIENARLYWMTQSQGGREFLVNQLTRAIRKSLEIDSILTTTVQEIGKVMGLSRCLIHYRGDPFSPLNHYQYVMPGLPGVENLTQLADYEAQVFYRRSDPESRYNPYVLNDARQSEDAALLLETFAINSLAVFPILLEDTNFVGTISLHQCDNYRAWLAEEIELLKAIAEHVAVALSQAKLLGEKEWQRYQLEQTVKELQQAQIQLVQSEKMAVLGQFVAGIAHEVNTPLGTIRANDDTVQKCVEHWVPETDQDKKYQQSAISLLKINQMAAERIHEIVRNLRNFARLDESDLKPADIHEGIEATLLMLESSCKGRITFKRHYGNLPMVECFPGLLNQVFMNLVVNAIQAIEGPGTITIETSLNETADEAAVVISDTGKGIPPEHMARIFDPGFTTKGVGVGTGLGLALCFKILEKHRGRIAVQSKPGEGTRMTVTFPVEQSFPSVTTE